SDVFSSDLANYAQNPVVSVTAIFQHFPLRSSSPAACSGDIYKMVPTPRHRPRFSEENVASHPAVSQTPSCHNSDRRGLPPNKLAYLIHTCMIPTWTASGVPGPHRRQPYLFASWSRQPLLSQAY